MPSVFSHVEYCDMHFVYRFCDSNARAAVDEYQRRFPDRRISSGSVENSSFWTFFNSSVTASWISATSAKWNPFNFIFNLGNRK